MPKDRRSFFERLTGSISVSEDREENLIDSEPEISQEETWVPQQNQEEETEPEGELSVDVYQLPTEIVIQTMVAGVKPDNLDISITREMVTIKGHRDRPSSTSGADYFHKELYWGSFSRTILLPAEIETEEADALEKHGLLTIRLPKIDKDRTQKLKVKTD